MSEHSPGPWRVDEPDWDHTPELSVRAADGQLVCTLIPWGGRAGWEDARLIAAAPDLLEELRDAVDCVDPGRAGHKYHTHANCTCVICRSRALIARIAGPA